MSQVVHKTVFNPNPVQRNFIESRAKADLFSSRMGEGKSTAIAWACLYHTRHNPGAPWAIIRDTYENIVGTTQKTFFTWFPPGIFGTYNASRKTFTWASGVAEGEVVFMGMDDQQDASKLMSRELGGFAIDEPAPAVGSAGVDEMIFDIALSRLRYPGMKWYAAKLAENNPDEAHWTYRRFVSPGDPEFKIWQPQVPENILNLPADYYQTLRKTWAHRPDLIRRFVEGEFGFQQLGKAVTPQWNDKFHLAVGLVPVPRQELILCWDFGHNPTCIITQIAPSGHWYILESHVGEGIGAEELIEYIVAPILAKDYRGYRWRHIGDPAGTIREQGSIKRTPVHSIRSRLGGPWKSGPVKQLPRLEPLRAVLTKAIQGRGLVQVDRDRARHVWHALRGGWHYNIARSGLVSDTPVKNEHSHPGDALSYAAAVLFPLGKLQNNHEKLLPNQGSSAYFGGGPAMERPRDVAEKFSGKRLYPGFRLPEHGEKLEFG